MADKPNRPAPLQTSDIPHAPFVFFDDAPVFNNYNGIIGITLAANRTVPNNKGGTTNDKVVVAYLRGNIQAALALRKAIDNALLLGVKTEGKTN
jgi:hypothetical protein